MAALSDIKKADRYSLIGGPFGSKLGRNDYQPEGIPVIRGVNLPAEARFSFDDFVYVSEKKAREELRANLAFPGDVIVTQRGTLGQVGLIPHSSPYDAFVLSQSQMKVTVDDRVADPEFIYYALRSPIGQHEILGRAVSAGVPHINLGLFESMRIPLPGLPIQRKIAAILTAYDELIENSGRRIKIQQELAQRIYREWFVEFRYPKHQRVSLVESELGPIPDGWDVVPLGTIAKVNARTVKPGQGLDEILYVDISSVSTGRIDPPIGYRFIEAPGRARRAVYHGDVIWSTVRPNRRSHALVIDPPANLVASTGFAVLSSEGVPFSFLYRLVTTDDFVGYLTNRATGAAYPAVTGGAFEEARVVRPPDALLLMFRDLVEPMDVLVGRLEQQITQLRTSRDLLLSGLISGEVHVENVDITLGKPAALR